MGRCPECKGILREKSSTCPHCGIFFGKQKFVKKFDNDLTIRDYAVMTVSGATLLLIIGGLAIILFSGFSLAIRITDAVTEAVQKTFGVDIEGHIFVFAITGIAAMIFAVLWSVYITKIVEKTKKDPEEDNDEGENAADGSQENENPEDKNTS